MATGDYFRATWIPNHDQMAGVEAWPGETSTGGVFTDGIAGDCSAKYTWTPAERLASWGALSNCEVTDSTAPSAIDPPLPPIWPYPVGLIYGREYFSVILYMIRGDTYSFSASVKRNGAAFDLTGCDLKFSAKWEYADADGDAAITLGLGTGVTVTDAAAGELTVEIPASATESLPAEEVQLYYDIQVVNPAGKVYTALRGTLVVRPDVTVAS